jgi:hypothetical protein
MDDEMRNVAALAGKNSDVVNKLDQILVGPNDRAYVVCNLMDCKLNIKGRCTIYAVLDVPRMKRSQPCAKYSTEAEAP